MFSSPVSPKPEMPKKGLKSPNQWPSGQAADPELQGLNLLKTVWNYICCNEISSASWFFLSPFYIPRSLLFPGQLNLSSIYNITMQQFEIKEPCCNSLILCKQWAKMLLECCCAEFCLLNLKEKCSDTFLGSFVFKSYIWRQCRMITAGCLIWN